MTPFKKYLLLFMILALVVCGVVSALGEKSRPITAASSIMYEGPIP